MDIRFIDSHCHLNAALFNNTAADVIASAQEVGVVGLIVVSESCDDFQRTMELAEEFKGYVHPCLGVHPVQKGRSVQLADLDRALDDMERHAERTVAVGEIGLDFTPWICFSEDDKLVQKEVFKQQLLFARNHNLPVNVHSRSAAKEVIKLLKETGTSKALLHNFAGKRSTAVEALSLGCKLSFPPKVIVQPDRTGLLQWIPPESLCLETDSPALSCREGVNEPKHIIQVFEYICKLKPSMEPKAIANTCVTNSSVLFNLDKVNL